MGLPIEARYEIDAFGRRYRVYTRGEGFRKRLDELKRARVL